VRPGGTCTPKLAFTKRVRARGGKRRVVCAKAKKPVAKKRRRR
jgi:hypothetical protein